MAILLIFVKIWRKTYQFFTLVFSTVDSFGSIYTEFFCNLIFCQYDTVSVLRIAADSNRHIFILRKIQQLYGCIKIVHITVENAPVIIYIFFFCYLFRQFVTIFKAFVKHLYIPPNFL